ncbi:MAG: hypothetical protein ACUVTZ_06185 [Armatimonadota bacterium]
MRTSAVALAVMSFGSLIGGLSFSGRGSTVPSPAGPTSRPAQERIAVCASLSPKAHDPAWIASHSPLIVRARVAAKEPARWVKGHPVIGRRHPGDYAWHDFIFDQVELIWKADDVPHPGNQLRVRVYDAETPEVSFTMEHEPHFEVGERYILMLTDVDAFAFNVGPEHWRTREFSSFLIVGDKVLRKGFEDHPVLTLGELQQAIADGVRSPETAHYKAWRSTQMRGIKF